MKKKLTELLKGRDRNTSDKQFLVSLQRKGIIGKGVLRVMARKLDEMIGKGEKDALSQVVAAYEEGMIRDPEKARKMDNLPKLADVPEHFNAKQALLWLKQKGSLGKDQLRRAAKLLDERQQAGEPLDVAFVLAQVDAGALLSQDDLERLLVEAGHGGTVDTIKKAVDDAAKKVAEKRASKKAAGDGAMAPRSPQEGDEGSGEGEGKDEGDDGPQGSNEGVDEPTEAQVLVAKLAKAPDDRLAHIVHNANAPEVLEVVRATTDPAFLERLHVVERANPKYKDGRKGVLDAIEERRGELAVPDPNEG